MRSVPNGGRTVVTVSFWILNISPFLFRDNMKFKGTWALEHSRADAPKRFTHCGGGRRLLPAAEGWPFWIPREAATVQMFPLESHCKENTCSSKAVLSLVASWTVILCSTARILGNCKCMHLDWLGCSHVTYLIINPLLYSLCNASLVFQLLWESLWKYVASERRGGLLGGHRATRHDLVNVQRVISGWYAVWLHIETFCNFSHETVSRVEELQGLSSI